MATPPLTGHDDRTDSAATRAGPQSELLHESSKMSAECTPRGYVTSLIAYGLDGMTGSVQTVPEGAHGVGHELVATAKACGSPARQYGVACIHPPDDRNVADSPVARAHAPRHPSSPIATRAAQCLEARLGCYQGDARRGRPRVQVDGRVHGGTSEHLQSAALVEVVERHQTCRHELTSPVPSAKIRKRKRLRIGGIKGLGPSGPHGAPGKVHGTVTPT